MTLTTDGVLKFTNMPVQGVIDGNPDGVFGGSGLITGDASGGDAVARLLLGSLIVSAPIDIIMKLGFAQMTNATSSTTLLQCKLGFTPSINDLFWASPDQGATGAITVGANMGSGLVASLGPGQSLEFSPPQGLFTWPQKGDNTVYMLAQTTNPGVGSFGTLSIQGVYWYIGPRRLAAMSLP